jgi:hypothetical protein
MIKGRAEIQTYSKKFKSIYVSWNHQVKLLNAYSQAHIKVAFTIKSMAKGWGQKET